MITVLKVVIWAFFLYHDDQEQRTFLGILNTPFSSFYKNLGYEKTNETKKKKEILSHPYFFSYVAHPILWSLSKHEPSLGGWGGMLQ